MDARKCELLTKAARLVNCPKSILKTAVENKKVRAVTTEAQTLLVYMPDVRRWDDVRQKGPGNPDWIAKKKKRKEK